MRSLWIIAFVVACGPKKAAEPPEPSGPLHCPGPAATGEERTNVVMADAEDVCPLFAAVGVVDDAEVAEARSLEAISTSCPSDSSCYVEVAATTIGACRAFAARVLLRHAAEHYRVNLSVDCKLPEKVTARANRRDGFEIDSGDDVWFFRVGS